MHAPQEIMYSEIESGNNVSPKITILTILTSGKVSSFLKVQNVTALLEYFDLNHFWIHPVLYTQVIQEV